MENIEKTQQTSSEKVQSPAGSDGVLPDVKANLRYGDGARGDMQSLPTNVVPSDSESKMEGILDETVSTQQIQATEQVQANVGEVGESQASATTADGGTGSSVEEDEPMTLVEEIFDLVEELGAKVASRPVGQTLFRQGEHVLDILESCMAWFESSADSDQAVQRPLPWFTFLPMLATLRVAVYGAKVVAPLFGRKSKSTHEVVAYIRSQRRKIHAIRYKGICNMKNEAKDSKQNHPAENIRLIEKLLLWWPITVVTKMANIVGLGSEDPESSKTSPVKRSYEQMVKDDMLLDRISPPSPIEETSSSEEDEVEEEEEGKVETMFADDIIKRITEINFEEEDSEDDPDYVPPEESDGTSETSSEEDFTDEENPSAGTEMATNTEVEQEEEERKLKVPRLEIMDSDSKTITPENSPEDKIEDKPEDNGEKELFFSATSSGYQSPEHPSSRRESRGSSPTAELRADTPRPVNESSAEKKLSKLSSLFSRKKT